VAAFFARRGVTPRTLAVGGLAFATLATLCYVVLHPGLAGVLGLIALGLSEVALVRRAGAEPPETWVGGLNLLTDLAIPLGYVAAAAVDESGVRLLFALLVLLLFAWLPYLEAIAPEGVLAPGKTFWRRPERLGVLLVGGLLAPPLVVLLLVCAAGGIDASLAGDRLARIGREPRTRPAFLDALLKPDGSIHPLLRWGSLVIVLLLLLVLPQGEAWRF